MPDCATVDGLLELIKHLWDLNLVFVSLFITWVWNIFFSLQGPVVLRPSLQDRRRSLTSCPTWVEISLLHLLLKLPVLQTLLILHILTGPQVGANVVLRSMWNQNGPIDISMSVLVWIRKHHFCMTVVHDLCHFTMSWAQCTLCSCLPYHVSTPQFQALTFILSSSVSVINELCSPCAVCSTK